MSKYLTFIALCLGLTACGTYEGRKSNCWGAPQAFAFDGSTSAQQDCSFTHSLPGAAN